MQLDRSYQLNKKILNLFTTGSAELGINLSDIQIQKFSKFVFFTPSSKDIVFDKTS